MALFFIARTEDGSFDELLSKESGYFKKLWDNQVNGMVV